MVYHEVVYSKTQTLMRSVIGAVFCAVVLASPAYVHAVETIASFDARITVGSNATVEVAEAIEYDFGDVQRHGIFRVIPYSYQADKETYTANVSSVTVADKNGVPLPFTESRSGGELTLKIGDPDVFVTGVQSYVISYVVTGPFLYFEDYDEFYWNVTGMWPNAIARASVLVDLPLGAEVLDAACYQGQSGAASPCTKGEKLINAERAGYVAVAEALGSNEGLTVAIAFPKGTIAEVERTSSDSFMAYMGWIVGGVLPVGILVALGFLWYTRGRDPATNRAIVPLYEPPEGVPPGLAGLLYDEAVDVRDVTAVMIDLAVQGHLRIHRLEDKALGVLPKTDYLFELLPAQTAPTGAGALLLDALRNADYQGVHDDGVKKVEGALFSKMQQTWSVEQGKITRSLYEESVHAGYFTVSPYTVRVRYGSVGAIILIAGALLEQVTGIGLGLVIVGVCAIVASRWMPAKTLKGVMARDALEGFKRYLTVAEKDRLQFHNAPEKNPELFDRFLPYALALGVEEQWAAQFADLAQSERTWYVGKAGTFTATALARDLSAFSRDVSSAAAPKGSGSRGGGRSGGGFGGGRGGSW